MFSRGFIDSSDEHSSSITPLVSTSPFADSGRAASESIALTAGLRRALALRMPVPLGSAMHSSDSRAHRLQPPPSGGASHLVFER